MKLRDMVFRSTMQRKQKQKHSMAKTKAKQKEKEAAPAKQMTREEATQQASANPRLVEALRGLDQAKQMAKSYLVTIGEIAQSEQLSKPEILASIMEARGVTFKTAESQFSRMRKIIEDPETLEALRTGEIDLRTAREQTKKTQKNPSAAKKQESLEKRYKRAVSGLVDIAKEMGTDLNSLLASLKATFKAAGIK